MNLRVVCSAVTADNLRMHGGDVDDSGRHVLSGINDDALSEDDGDENSIHENPDADLLAFNVEMGMVPMSSVNSLGGLAGSDTDAPRRRQKRINSHSEPLGDMATQASGTSQRAASPRAASPRAGSGTQDSAEAPAPPRHVARAVSADSYGGAITNSGALFDYFTGSQDSWDQDGQGGTGAAGQPTSARRRSSKGTGPGETVLHKYVCCCCCFLPLRLVASVLSDGCTLHTTASLLQLHSVSHRRTLYLTCTTTTLQDHEHGVVLLQEEHLQRPPARAGHPAPRPARRQPGLHGFPGLVNAASCGTTLYGWCGSSRK
jgi:hypothetical protein